MIDFRKSAALIATLAALGLAACEPAKAPETASATAPAPDLSVKADEKTPLDAYIAKPEAVYGWKLNSTIAGDGYTAYVLELTSQTWRKPEKVDRTVWTHWLTIVKPAEVKSDKALLYIGGGDNGDPAPTKAADRDVRIARETGSIVANLGMVPNQPLHFSDSKDVARFEDDLIAYTRVQHFITKDDEWLVRLAMVKSGIKAMDAVTEFMASEEGGQLPVKQLSSPADRSAAGRRGWSAQRTSASSASRRW